MAIKTEWRDPNGLTGISCLSSDTKPDAPAGSICWETDTGSRFERDGDTWQPTGTGGAAHVSQNGAVTAVSGQVTTYTLNAETAAGSGALAGQFITDAAAKGFTVDAAEAWTAGDAITVAWSTTTGRQANLTTILDALNVAIVTPDGAGHSNAAAMTITSTGPLTVLYDGTNLINTISVAAVATAKDVIIRTIV